MEASVACTLCESLGSIDGNSLPNTDEAKRNHARFHFSHSKILDDGITEDEIFQRCFVIRQPKIEHWPRSKKECRQSLLDLCKSLLKNQSKTAGANCNMCGVSVNRQAYKMVTHACAHLEVKLFKCRHCNYSASSGNKIPSHVTRVHSILKPTEEDFEDKTVDLFDDITKRVKRCFSANYPRASELQRQFVIRRGYRDNRQQSIAHLCRSIDRQRSKPETLECNLCGSRIRLRRNGEPAINTSWMYEHAAAHLEVKLFTCRHCDRSLSSKGAMKTHLKKCHQIIGGNNDDFEDRSEECHSEYLNMIERCFSAVQIKLEASSVKDTTLIKGESTIRRLTIGSRLNVERNLFCNRLIRKIVDSDGRIKCSLCTMRIAFKSSGSTQSKPAYFHAEMHLQKALYCCKVCKRQLTTQPAVVSHLRKKHALGRTNNYECIADEFHEEFMAILSKCYVA